jgi:serine O-acetyltransferase
VTRRDTVTSRFWLDAGFHYRRPLVTTHDRLRALVNPSVLAAQLFRWSARSTGVAHLLARWTLLALFSCDVGSGVRFAGAIDLPHPVGVVIGSGSRIGPRCTIYQNTTIGRSAGGGYPTIGADVTVFPGAVVFGGIELAPGRTIGANSVVSHGRTA